MNFTLDGSVVDVRWSPLSSLIFAAIDNTGYIYFFNLKQNENKQVHQDNQINTVKSSQGGGQREIHLTRLSFNEEYKIMLVSDDSGGLNVYLPHPKLLVTGEDDDGQKKKKGDGEEKEKLDYTGKLLNIPGVQLNKVTRRKKNNEDEGKTEGLNLRDQEIKRMNAFLKKLEKHNQIIDN